MIERPPLRLIPGELIGESNARLLHTLTPVEHWRLSRGPHIGSGAVQELFVGDEYPTYAWSPGDHAWVLVDVVRAR